GVRPDGHRRQVADVRVPSKERGGLHAEESPETVDDAAADLAEVQRLRDRAAKLREALGRAAPPLRLLQLRGLLDGDGGVGGEQAEQVLLLLGEPAARAREHRQYADDP